MRSCGQPDQRADRSSRPHRAQVRLCTGGTNTQQLSTQTSAYTIHSFRPRTITDPLERAR
jgi:hypothetical protein